MTRSKTKDKETNKRSLKLDRDVLIKIALLIAFTSVLVFSLIWGRGFSPETIAGTGMITALLLIILYRDSIRYKPEIKKEYKHLILVGILLCGNMVIGRSFHYVAEGLQSGLALLILFFWYMQSPLQPGPCWQHC
jgi:4-hydroxybenzoate polyprenyltransferase